MNTTTAALATVATALGLTVAATTTEQQPIVVTSDRTIQVDAGPFNVTAHCGNGQAATGGGYKTTGRRVNITASQPNNTELNDGSWGIEGTAGRGGATITITVKCIQFPS